MSFSLRFILALATSSLWSPVLAVAPPSISVPACNPELPLATANSLGQTPCQVAGYLGFVCNTGYNIPSLVATQRYTLSQGDLVNNCSCSTVFYSALSACANCQGVGYVTWPQWSTNCSSAVFASVYPNPVPPYTEIPHWAFQSYPSSDPNATFNVTLAVAQGDSPESVAPTGASSTSAATGSGAPSPTSSSSGGKSEAGAIAGGVVGGLAFICLLAVGAVFYRRRNRNRESRSPGPILDGVDMQTATPTPFVSQSSSPPMKLYDPSDPSTFPQSHLTQDTSYTTHYRSLSDSSAGLSGYTGNAEV